MISFSFEGNMYGKQAVKEYAEFLYEEFFGWVNFFRAIGVLKKKQQPRLEGYLYLSEEAEDTVSRAEDQFYDMHEGMGFPTIFTSMQFTGIDIKALLLSENTGYVSTFCSGADKHKSAILTSISEPNIIIDPITIQQAQSNLWNNIDSLENLSPGIAEEGMTYTRKIHYDLPGPQDKKYSMGYIEMGNFEDIERIDGVFHDTEAGFFIHCDPRMVSEKMAKDKETWGYAKGVLSYPQYNALTDKLMTQAEYCSYFLLDLTFRFLLGRRTAYTYWNEDASDNFSIRLESDSNAKSELMELARKAFYLIKKFDLRDRKNKPIAIKSPEELLKKIESNEYRNFAAWRSLFEDEEEEVFHLFFRLYDLEPGGHFSFTFNRAAALSFFAGEWK